MSRPAGSLRAISRRVSRLLAVGLVALLATGACGSTGDSADAPAELPIRPGERTVTSYTVPHVQHNVDPVPEVDAELRRRIYSLPDLEERESIVSISGTSALWLADGVEVIEPDAMLREREFAHLHPDGSLHAVLPVDRAVMAIEAKWAEFHPWVGRADFWDGMVMLYTPQTMQELDVTWQLVVDSYNLVTGRDVDADDYI